MKCSVCYGECELILFPESNTLGTLYYKAGDPGKNKFINRGQTFFENDEPYCSPECSLKDYEND